MEVFSFFLFSQFTQQHKGKIFCSNLYLGKLRSQHSIAIRVIVFSDNRGLTYVQKGKSINQVVKKSN